LTNVPITDPMTMNGQPVNLFCCLVHTPHACQHLADERRAAFGGEDPGSAHEWRFMPHVLTVPALELRHPVSLVVEVKAGDAAGNARSVGEGHGAVAGEESWWRSMSSRRR
jgi:hypothetical protein